MLISNSLSLYFTSATSDFETKRIKFCISLKFGNEPFYGDPFLFNLVIHKNNNNFLFLRYFNL